MIMKRRTLTLSLILICVFSMMLSGCGKNEKKEDQGNNKEEKKEDTVKETQTDPGKLYDLKLEDVEKAVTGDLGLPSMLRVDKKDEDAETIFGAVLDIPYDRVEDFVYLYSEEGLADEILLVKLNTTEGVLDIKSQMEERISDRRSTFEAYNPAEVKKCDGAKVNIKGNFAAMIICERASYASQEFLKLFE